MPEDVIKLPEHGFAAGPTAAAGEAGHADGADGDLPPVPAAQDHFLIDDTIAFIHRTVSEKVLEAALLIGDYMRADLLTDGFADRLNDGPVLSILERSRCRSI